MKITDYIVEVMVCGYLDFPERILDEFKIPYKGLSEDEAWDKCDKFLSAHFKILSVEKGYFDKEESTVYGTVYYRNLDDNNIYGIDYRDSIHDFETESEPYKVEEYTESVTKYRKINEIN